MFRPLISTGPVFIRVYRSIRVNGPYPQEDIGVQELFLEVILINAVENISIPSLLLFYQCNKKKKKIYCHTYTTRNR